MRAIIFHSVIFGAFLSVVVLPSSPSPIPMARAVEFIPQISVFSPSRLSLGNGESLSSYTELANGIPAISMGLALPLYGVEKFELHAVTGLGYSFKEGHFSWERLGRTTDEIVRLHRPFATVGIRARYMSSLLPFLKPSLTLATGVEWLIQRGGPSLNAILPRYSLGPAVTFLDQSHLSGDWFGGFTFGVVYHSTLSVPVQRVEGWSFDLSMNLLL